MNLKYKKWKMYFSRLITPLSPTHCHFRNFMKITNIWLLFSFVKIQYDNSSTGWRESVSLGYIYYTISFKVKNQSIWPQSWHWLYSRWPLSHLELHGHLLLQSLKIYRTISRDNRIKIWTSIVTYKCEDRKPANAQLYQLRIWLCTFMYYFWMYIL